MNVADRLERIVEHRMKLGDTARWPLSAAESAQLGALDFILECIEQDARAVLNALGPRAQS